MLIGLVGKPSAGKSTFFRASTLAEAEVANYPFTTIKPNHGVGYAKVECVDKEFDTQCNPRTGFCINHWRFVPIDLMDVAGLVPGAHSGLGMGNQFLDDLRVADALIHVVDCSGSTNEKGEPVDPGSYDPSNDIIWLEDELDLWYLGILKKGWEKFARSVMQEKSKLDVALAKQVSGLGISEDHVTICINKLNLNREKPNEWSESELKSLASELRKLTKPMIIACNKIDTGKDLFEKMKQKFDDRILVPVSAESELALREAAKAELINYIPGEDKFDILKPDSLSDKQKGALKFVQDKILSVHESTGVQDVLDKATYELLNLMAIFPGGVNKLEDKDGNRLPDCFLIPNGSTALDFAYKIHTDLGKGFIRAIDVKTKRTVGKEHVLKHRDVVEIISNK